MARINVEDQFWVEVVGLALAMQDQDKAYGHALRFFKFAQDRHKEARLITESDFKSAGFNEALFPVFAKRIDGGIMCVGAEKHFGWLRTRVEAGSKGGSQSTESKRLAAIAREHKKAEERNGSDDITRPQAKPETTSKPKQAQPSSSYSPSSSGSCSDSRSKKKNTSPKGTRRAPVDGSVQQRVIAHYCDEWKRAYKVTKSPDIVGSAVGQLGRLIADLGEARVKVLITAYTHMGDQFYLRKRHDVGTFVSNVTAVSHFADTKRLVTATEARQIEEQSTQLNLKREIMEEGV